MGACLRALARQTFPPDQFEVVVCDDGSTDATRAIVERFAQTAPFRLRLLRRRPDDVHGPGFARGDAWRACEGDVLLATDADCVPDPAWIAEAVAAVRERGEAVVFGATVAEDLLLFPHRAAAIGWGVTGNCAARRDVFQTHAFDPSFVGLYGEDADYFLRIERAGVRIARVPGMRVLHPVKVYGAKTLAYRAFSRKNEALLHKKHGGRAAPFFHPFFRAFGRTGVSPMFLAVVGFFLAAVLLIATVPLRLVLVLFAASAVMGGIWFLCWGYKTCIIFLPPDAPPVSVRERVRTLASLVLYMPCLLAARVYGSVRYHTWFV